MVGPSVQAKLQGLLWAVAVKEAPPLSGPGPGGNVEPEPPSGIHTYMVYFVDASTGAIVYAVGGEVVPGT